jgi:hypothetical protein
VRTRGPPYLHPRLNAGARDEWLVRPCTISGEPGGHTLPLPLPWREHREWQVVVHIELSRLSGK